MIGFQLLILGTTVKPTNSTILLGLFFSFLSWQLLSLVITLLSIVVLRKAVIFFEFVFANLSL